MQNKTKYTKQDFQIAYTDWSNSNKLQQRKRDELWDKYCDMRDGLPLETTHQIRKLQEKEERLESNNRRILEQNFKERLQAELEEKQYLKIRQKIETEECKLHQT